MCYEVTTIKIRNKLSGFIAMAGCIEKSCSGMIVAVESWKL